MSTVLVAPAMAAQPYSASKFPQATSSGKFYTQEDPQNQVNIGFANAALRGNKEQVEYYLKLPDGRIKPNQDGIKWGLSNAASYPITSAKLEILKLLLNLPAGQIKPNQDALNDAILVAASSGNAPAVSLLLNRPAGEIRPDQKGIIEAHQEAVSQGRSAIIEMLKPYLPSSVGQNQRSSAAAVSPALASGVSTASNKGKSEVPLSPSFPSSAVKPPKPIGFVAPPMVQGALAVSASASSSSYVVSDEEKARLKGLQSIPNGVNNAFITLAKQGKQEEMEFMLSLPEGNGRPNKNGIYMAFLKASHYGQKGIMEWMLKIGLKPGKNGFNDAFIEAARAGKKEIMEWMLSLLEGRGRPDQDAVNQAFTSVVSVVIPMIVSPGKNEIYDNSMYGHTTVDYALGIMGWMLSNDRPLRPEQDVITKQYQDLVALKKGNYMSDPNYRSMVNLLEPYVPVSARQNQGSSVAAVAPGLASGVPTVSNKGKSEVVLSLSLPSSAVVKPSKPMGFVAPPRTEISAAIGLGAAG